MHLTDNSYHPPEIYRTRDFCPHSPSPLSLSPSEGGLRRGAGRAVGEGGGLWRQAGGALVTGVRPEVEEGTAVGSSGQLVPAVLAATTTTTTLTATTMIIITTMIYATMVITTTI